MKELSLNILDVAENSIRARAKNIMISLFCDEKGILTLKIEDDGCGMDEERLKRVNGPLNATVTARKSGLGIPLLKLAASQAGGYVNIQSEPGKGTRVIASFDTNNAGFKPMGDMPSTVTALMMGAPEVDFLFEHKTPSGEVKLDTKELRAVTGDLSLASAEVIMWIKDYLREQYDNLGGNSL